MNIYITSRSFSRNAEVLPNAQLKAQYAHLATIICNVLHADTSILSILPDASLYGAKLLPAKNENHRTTEWAKQSSLHFLFILYYFIACHFELKNRNLIAAIPGTNSGFVNLSTSLMTKYADLLCARTTDGLLSFKQSDLYNGVPDALKKETVTASYKNYLTNQWKSVQEDNYKFEKGLVDRKPPRLRWGHQTVAPAWAEEHLKKYLKELKNAG